jgi:hypothetical protein
LGWPEITPNALEVTEPFGPPNNGGNIRVVQIERKAHDVTAALGLTGDSLARKGTVPGSREPGKGILSCRIPSRPNRCESLREPNLVFQTPDALSEFQVRDPQAKAGHLPTHCLRPGMRTAVRRADSYLSSPSKPLIVLFNIALGQLTIP